MTCMWSMQALEATHLQTGFFLPIQFMAASPKMAPINSYPLLITPMNQGWICVTNRTWWKWQCIAALSWPLVSLTQGETSCCAMRTFKQPWRKELRGLPPAATTNMPAMWVRYLRSESSCPSQAFRWLQPQLALDRNLFERPESETLSWVLSVS